MRQVNGPLTNVCFFNLEQRNTGTRISVTTLEASVDLLREEVRSLTKTVAAVTNQVAALANQVAELADQVAEQRTVLNIFGGSLVLLAIGLISSTMTTRKR
jgi:uncharacterized coiled-coil protein SlyX